MFLTNSEIHHSAKKELDIDALQSLCGECKLYKDCKTSKMPITGLGKKKILVVGETPSDADDQNGIQFAGDSGIYLAEILKKNGISLRKDCWSVNAVRCNNSLEKLGNTAKLCSGYLKRKVYELKPDLVLILGDAGLTTFLSDSFKERESVTWRGFHFYDELYDTTFFCAPSQKEVSIPKNYLLKAVFERDIKKVFSTNYNKRRAIVDYEKYVKHLTVFKDVVDVLKSVLRNQNSIYFDYETSGLKPFRNGHFIASIAFAISPTESYAFPFKFNNYWTESQYEEIKNLWYQILINKEVKKSSQNLKYEDNWSSIIIGTRPFGWVWDTMITSHILDNRSNWTGLKFQTFINFGVRPYDKFIEQYTKSDKGEEFNTIHKAPLKDLLTYNGLDCIFGWMLMEKQKTELSGKKGLIAANSFFLRGTLAMSRIQLNGICMDEEYYAKQKKQLTYHIKKLRRELTSGREAKKFYEKFNRQINLNSGQDLGKLFFEILGAQAVYTGNKNAKGDKNYKTDVKTLEKLNLPYVSKLIEMKKLIKARDTYLAQFAREVYDGMTYPFFDLNTAATFRSSSSRPNWQNLPKRDDNIKKIVRSGIIPKDNSVLSEIDFSGAEVATSVAYHKDPTFLAYLKDKDSDMHRDQALILWKLDEKELNNPDFTREQKSQAKKIRFYTKNNWTFAEFYGDWHDSCGRNLWENCIEREKLVLPSGKTLEEHINSCGIYTVEDFIENCKVAEDLLWNERFPIYTKWKKDIAKFYQRNGYIETYLGFRFVGIMDRKQCGNYPIQGTSFHLLVYTILEVEKFIFKNKLKTTIVGQIHDSIISNVHVDEIEIYHRGVSTIISNIHNVFKWFPIQMECECSITKPKEQGGNFSSLYEIKPTLLDGTAEFSLEEIYGKAV